LINEIASHARFSVNLAPNHDNPDTSPVLKRLTNHHKGKSVRRLAFMNDHDLVSASKTIKIYDLNQEQFSRQLSNQGGKVYAMKTVDDQTLITGDDLGTLRMFDLRQGNDPIWSEKQCEEYISDLDLDASKRMLLATSGDGSLSAINIRTKKLCKLCSSNRNKYLLLVLDHISHR
jgi:WD40 repeat protein